VKTLSNTWGVTFGRVLWLKFTGLSGALGGQRLSLVPMVGAQSTAAMCTEPTVPGRTGLSSAPSNCLVCPRTNGWQRSASPNKEGNHTLSLSGVHWIVRCAHGQKATRAFQMKNKQLSWPLGYKRTPRRMEP
jgi:hypothetical protein